MTGTNDLDPAFSPIYNLCRDATMTPVERVYALYKAVEYIVDAGIPGDFAECGVWRGGSIMAMAATLLAKRKTDRRIFLYDTFDGMPRPTEADSDFAGRSAADLLASHKKSADSNLWAYAPLEEVKRNLRRVPYPMDKFRFVQGKVEDTIPQTLPGPLALLRLDTDWYESTKHELEHLYPLLVPGGVLIIDDYGWWKGCRRAVDEYFREGRRRILLNRIDYSGRIGVKPIGTGLPSAESDCSPESNRSDDEGSRIGADTNNRYEIQSPKVKCGVAYVATTHDRYIEEAYLSADSIKSKHPDIHVTLFTDLTSNLLCATSAFDSVVPIQAASGYGSAWAEGLLSRIRSIQQSPYEYTLHLDTDTRVLTHELPSLFALLDEYDVAMVETTVDDSYSRQRYGRPMYNGGFILFRQNEKTSRWLARWEKLTEEHYLAARQTPIPSVPAVSHVVSEDVRRSLLYNDQISLVQLLNPEGNVCGLKVKTLDYSWNNRGSQLKEKNREPVKISHRPALKVATRSDILIRAYESMLSERQDQAEILYRYLASRQHVTKKPSLLVRLLGRSGEENTDTWPSPTHMYAHLHVQAGQLEIAAHLYDQLLRKTPSDAAAILGASEIAFRRNLLLEALQGTKLALELVPDDPGALQLYGRILIALGTPLDAVTPLEKAVRKDTHNAEHAFQLGQAWMALKEYSKATAAFKKAIDRDKDHFGANNNLMPALLGARRYSDALEHSKSLDAENAWHVPALAFRAVALAEMSRKDELRRLVDLERWVSLENLSPPKGWASLKIFNRALAKELVSLKSLEHAPPRHATRHGLHSGDLSNAKEPAIAALNASILQLVDRYSRALEGSDSHPFVKAIPSNYRFYSWTIIMEDQGHQIPHIHSRGWLSGVYYVELPNSINAEDPSHAGWLALGRAEEMWHRPETVVPTRYILPQEGMLVTFPSYYWHNTVPVRTPRRRISYAFDILPLS